jgi:RHH-type proline utilization regulon transcriptional repressor/proline dehydrogenase/delta 1-pyrroline-5-carboxylate dehydrogenase
VGAVVGVQPFGGEGLSGTGPKAGGPLYLYRMLAACPPGAAMEEIGGLERIASPGYGDARLAAFRALRDWARGDQSLEPLCDRLAEITPLGIEALLPGPTGERNTYSVLARSRVLCIAHDERDLLAQLAAVLAVGGRVLWATTPLTAAARGRLPQAVNAAIESVQFPMSGAIAFDCILHHGAADERLELARQASMREGPIVAVHAFEPGEQALPLERLLVERVVSVNTAAAGGNASLMTVG